MSHLLDELMSYDYWADAREEIIDILASMIKNLVILDRMGMETQEDLDRQANLDYHALAERTLKNHIIERAGFEPDYSHFSPMKKTKQ